jgi:hypothetical protein
VVESVKRQRRVGLEHDPIVICRLAPNVEEDLERDKVEAAGDALWSSLTTHGFFGGVKRLHSLEEDIIPMVSAYRRVKLTS